MSSVPQPAVEGLLVQLDSGVLTIRFHRPVQHNAIGVQMALGLNQLLEAAATQADVRLVLLCSAGQDFCAGADEADFKDTAAHGDAVLRSARAALEHGCTRALRMLPQPVIALVQGRCGGAAVGLLEACDIVVCADDARFHLPDALGSQVLSAVSAKALSQVVAPRTLSLHALTGQPFDGRQAERCGLVTLSLPAAELEPHVQALTADLLGKDPLALQFTKETLRHVGTMDWDAVLNFNAAKFAELKALQAGRPSPRAAAVESFLSGQSKPGLGA